MVQVGVAGRVESRLRLARRAGSFGGLEVFAFVVAYLAAGPRPSIRGFYDEWKDDLPRVAALVGRHDLPSSGSLSRALKSMTMAQAEAIADELLLNTPGLDALLGRDAVQHYDAYGMGWHIFDFDPTVRASRQRDLEEGDDLPDPERRALGVSGYTGRKRGEIRYRCHALHHGGAGLWLQCSLQDEGGSAVPYLERAAQKCRMLAERIGHPHDRVLLRTDGEFGHAAAVQACAQHGVHHLTRLTRPHLFDRPEVQFALAHARWATIEDSGTFEREAADLGELVLHDVDAEVEPVATRVVLTRFRTDREVPGRGVLRGGFQIELFGTSLPADAWPPEDVAGLYAGRAVLENRFAQEDREYALERRFSDSAPGQMFVVNVGLFLWNYAVCRVAEVRGVPSPKTRRQPRPPAPPDPPLLPEPEVQAEVETPVPPTMALAVAASASRPEATLPPTTDLDGDLDRIVAAAAVSRSRPGWTLYPVTGVRWPTSAGRVTSERWFPPQPAVANFAA
jgi:hypothetical protein